MARRVVHAGVEQVLRRGLVLQGAGARAEEHGSGGQCRTVQDCEADPHEKVRGVNRALPSLPHACPWSRLLRAGVVAGVLSLCLCLCLSRIHRINNLFVKGDAGRPAIQHRPSLSVRREGTESRVAVP